MRSRGIGILAGMLGASPRAWCSPCVSIGADPGAHDATRSRLVEQLGASLAQHAIAMCPPGEAPLAEVLFDATDRGIVVTIRDAVTGKELTRVVRVASIPRDGRPLALAVAADELLRASWAEILLARAPAPPPEPPPEVRAVVEASLPAAPAAHATNATPVARANEGPHAFFLSAAVAGEHTTGGLTLAGLDARFGAWAASRIGLGFHLGARLGPSVRGSDGAATVSALLGGGAILLALVPRGGPFELDLPLRFDAERVELKAQPAPGAQGHDASAVGVTTSSGLSAGFRVAPRWLLVGEANVGAVLQPVDARDGATTFAGLSGLQLGAALGVRVSL